MKLRDILQGMNPNKQNPVSGVAAANTIAQERTVAAVTFPLTGDAETDAMSGILAVLHHLSPGLGLDASIRVLEHIARRFIETREASLKACQQMGQGLGGWSATGVGGAPAGYGAGNLAPDPDPGITLKNPWSSSGSAGTLKP